MKHHDLPQKPSLSLVSMLTASVIFILFVVWLGVYQVEEVTRAPGILEPAVGNAPIQFPGSGIIVELPVQEGQAVKRGDTLIRIDSLNGTETLANLQEQLIILQAQRIRVQALARGQTPDLSAISRTHPDLGANQRQLFLNEMSSYRASIAVFENQKSSLEIQIKKSRADLEALETQIRLAREDQAIQNSLAKEGMTSRTQLINVERQLDTLLANQIQLPLTIQGLQEELNGIGLKQDEYVQNLFRGYNSELARIDEQIRLLQAQLESTKKTSRYMEISSPIDGRISGLKKRRAGEVISPNELIMEIVPAIPLFLARIKIPAQSIGYLHNGLSAKVTLDAYQQEPDAVISGTLAELSGSSLLDETNRPYYQGTIAISADKITVKRGSYPLLSGMTLNCQIITGKRSILEYIFHTILRSSNEAFRER